MLKDISLKRRQRFARIFIRILFSIVFLGSTFLDASIINPALASERPGFMAFKQGLEYFEAEKWDEAAYWFARAVEASNKPSFDCHNFWIFDGYISSCRDLELNSERDSRIPAYRRFYASHKDNIWAEISSAVYRHSHFYLGLIKLYRQQIDKAHLHFKEAISFGGDEDELGSLYFRCINYMNPSWIIYASLTSLSLGHHDLAEQFAELAYDTNNFLSDCVLDSWYWEGKTREKYWNDLQARKMNQVWSGLQNIAITNVKSLIAKAQGNANKAIYDSTRSIESKNYHFTRYSLSNETLEADVLNSNRGILYMEAGDYQEALLDFTKAIELKPFIADHYANRGLLYLIIEEYNQAIQDFNQACELNPANLEYYKETSARLFS